MPSRIPQALRRAGSRVLELGVPSGLLSREDRRRAQILTAATLGIAAIGVPSAAMYVRLGASWMALLVGAVATAGILNLALARFSRRLGVACHIGLGVLFCWLVAENVVVGGIFDPNFSWFYVVPLGALGLVGLRGAAFWLVATALATVGFYALAESGFEAPMRVPAEERGLQTLHNRLTALIAFVVVSAGFVRAQQRAAGDLVESNAELLREGAYVNLVRHAAVSASESVSFDGALAEAVRRIAEEMDWLMGQVYRVAPDGWAEATGALYTRPGFDRNFAPLVEMTRSTRHPPGQGLPGRAILARRVESLRLEDVPDSARSQAASRLGIRVAYAVPILARGEPVAVLEFASDGAEGRDERLESVLQHIGAQLGRVAERAATLEEQQLSERIIAVGHLAAGLAHELNNPLAYARTNLSMLGTAFEEAAESLEKDTAHAAESLVECEALLRETTEGVERAIAVVKDVRSLSSLGRSDFEEISVHDWVANAARFASPRDACGVRVEWQAPEGLHVYGAPTLLHQVLVNLIENAVQAVGGSGRVQVDAQLEGSGLLLRVTDSGPGIRADVRERLFEPFFTTKAEGTGLGLYLAYEIVRRHGGRLAVESQPGRTRFGVWLPLPHLQAPSS